MPLESCQKYTATLSEILALTPVVQTIADATDVPGVRLEWLNGAWYGDCGFPSAAQHSALLAANAYNSLGVGSRATLPSGPVTWRGAGSGGWGDVSTLSAPPASGTYVGQIIWVANPAVPRGRSRLEWTGTVWAPPAGEMIAAIWRGASPVALVTPGNTSLTVVYQSQIIPDYMLPANIKARICGFMSAKNAAGVANCLLAMAISGNVPTVTYQYAYAYPLGTAVTPNSAGIGIGLTPTNPRTPHCGIISVPNARNYFLQSFNAGPMEMASTDFQFVAGQNRVYAMAQPSGAADQIQLDGYSIVSEGNL